MQPRSLDSAEWPALLLKHCDHIAGVYVGGCVAGPRGFRAKAHAHNRGDYKGWLCVLAKRRLSDDALVLHELAHIRSGQGHTDEWRRWVIALGGTLNATDTLKDYHKREKKIGRYRELGHMHHADCPCRDASA